MMNLVLVVAFEEQDVLIDLNWLKFLTGCPVCSWFPRLRGLGGVVGLTLLMARADRFASRILPTVQRPFPSR